MNLTEEELETATMEKPQTPAWYLGNGMEILWGLTLVEARLDEKLLLFTRTRLKKRSTISSEAGDGDGLGDDEEDGEDFDGQEEEEAVDVPILAVRYDQLCVGTGTSPVQLPGPGPLPLWTADCAVVPKTGGSELGSVVAKSVGELESEMNGEAGGDNDAAAAAGNSTVGDERGNDLEAEQAAVAGEGTEVGGENLLVAAGFHGSGGGAGGGGGPVGMAPGVKLAVAAPDEYGFGSVHYLGDLGDATKLVYALQRPEDDGQETCFSPGVVVGGGPRALEVCSSLSSNFPDLPLVLVLPEHHILTDLFGKAAGGEAPDKGGSDGGGGGGSSGGGGGGSGKASSVNNACSELVAFYEAQLVKRSIKIAKGFEVVRAWDAKAKGSFCTLEGPPTGLKATRPRHFSAVPHQFVHSRGLVLARSSKPQKGGIGAAPTTTTSTNTSSGSSGRGGSAVGGGGAPGSANGGGGGGVAVAELMAMSSEQPNEDVGGNNNTTSNSADLDCGDGVPGEVYLTARLSIICTENAPTVPPMLLSAGLLAVPSQKPRGPVSLDLEANPTAAVAGPAITPAAAAAGFVPGAVSVVPSPASGCSPVGALAVDGKCRTSHPSGAVFACGGCAAYPLVLSGGVPNKPPPPATAVAAAVVAGGGVLSGGGGGGAGQRGGGKSGSRRRAKGRVSSAPYLLHHASSFEAVSEMARFVARQMVEDKEGTATLQQRLENMGSVVAGSSIAGTASVDGGGGGGGGGGGVGVGGSSLAPSVSIGAGGSASVVSVANANNPSANGAGANQGSGARGGATAAFNVEGHFSPVPFLSCEMLELGWRFAGTAADAQPVLVGSTQGYPKFFACVWVRDNHLVGIFLEAKCSAVQRKQYELAMYTIATQRPRIINVKKLKKVKLEVLLADPFCLEPPPLGVGEFRAELDDDAVFEAFRYYDVNGGGVVKTSSLGPIMTELGSDWDADETAEAEAAMDPTGKGTVSYEAFRAWWLN
jgi:hypothetical protein